MEVESRLQWSNERLRKNAAHKRGDRSKINTTRWATPISVLANDYLKKQRPRPRGPPTHFGVFRLCVVALP